MGVHACCSKNKPPPLTGPFQALPLGHPHRVSEDGKWVASLIEGSTRASAHSCQSPHAANGQSAHQPAQQQQQQQQQPTVGGSQIHKQIPDRACPNWIRTQKLIPRPPRELNQKFINMWSRSNREPTVYAQLALLQARLPLEQLLL